MYIQPEGAFSIQCFHERYFILCLQKKTGGEGYDIKINPCIETAGARCSEKDDLKFSTQKLQEIANKRINKYIYDMKYILYNEKSFELIRRPTHSHEKII